MLKNKLGSLLLSCSLLLAACGGGGGDSAAPAGSPLPPPTLQSIAVTPSNPSLKLGATQQLTATGTYSDGTTRDLTASVTWNSATPGVVAVSGGGLVAPAVAAIVG